MPLPCRMFLPAQPIMKAQNYGRIVNVSSNTGKNGNNSTVFVTVRARVR
jgi:hypothetical protein